MGELGEFETRAAIAGYMTGPNQVFSSMVDYLLAVLRNAFPGTKEALKGLDSRVTYLAAINGTLRPLLASRETTRASTMSKSLFCHFSTQG